MKKISFILILALLFVSLFTAQLRASAHADTGFGHAESLDGVQPTEQPIPPLDPSPSYEPLPGEQPHPSFAPHPDYDWNGPDEDGCWHSGYPFYEKLTEDEIRQLFADNPAEAALPVFDIYPSVQEAPYEAGRLSQENLERTKDYANVLRTLAGLNTLELSEEANYYAQYAAWLLCRNQSMSHTPSCDANVPTDFCQLGYYGCSSGNIAHSNSIYGFITYQIDAYMSDWQFNNVTTVGHRQHFLDPRLADFGFGSAGLFHSMFVGSKLASAQIGDYDFIAWPASGNFPADTEAFTILSPWSVSVPKRAVKAPSANDGLTVTVGHDGEIVSALTYGADPDHPEYVFSPAPYITLSMEYTDNYCIIFRPDLTDGTELEGEFTVTVSGLRNTSSDSEVTITYKVNFFDLDEGAADPEPAPSIVLGDADGDGLVTVADALTALRFSMGLIGMDDPAAALLDIDGDGAVDVRDVLQILRFALGIIRQP